MTKAYPLKHRLAIVLSHPVQYYSPWFRWMAQHSNLNFRIFYLWDAGVKTSHDQQFNTTFAWDIDLLSGYDYEFIPNTATHPGTNHFNGLKNPTLISRIRAWQPAAILLFGYKYRTHLRLILWARFRGLPLIFRGDSHLLGRPQLAWWKKAPLRVLYRQFSAFICTGLANHAYFHYFDVPKKRLFIAPHSVDASLFTSDDKTRSAAASLRDQLGIPSASRVILFAGKFVPAKQPLELLRGFLKMNADNAVLVFVGDGEEKAALKDLAISARAGSVHFLPFANQSEMPVRYELADIFILPSRGIYETWGLAVNEAMHMGVPCIVSDRVGCQLDLVTDGETGWVFNSEDPFALGKKLSQALAVLGDPLALARIKTAVAQRISKYTYADTFQGLGKALSCIDSQ